MSKTAVDLLIRDGLVITMIPDQRQYQRADVAVKKDKIFSIGIDLEVEPVEIIDAVDHVVMPGLINAHMHETLTRGTCEDLPLDRWLAEICFPLDRSYTFEIMRASALMNQAEMIRGGTTTFLDIYRHPEACAEVASLSGLRAILAPQIIVEPSGAGESIEKAQQFVSSWIGRNSRIKPAFGPHAPYSCPLDDYREVFKLAQHYDVPLHTHLSETKWEMNLVSSIL